MSGAAMLLDLAYCSQARMLVDLLGGVGAPVDEEDVAGDTARAGCRDGYSSGASDGDSHSSHDSVIVGVAVAWVWTMWSEGCDVGSGEEVVWVVDGGRTSPEASVGLVTELE